MNNQQLCYWQLIIRCVSIVEERRNLRICLVCFYLFSSFLSFFCFCFLFYQCLNFRVFLLLSKINWSQFFVSFPSWRLPRNIIVESLSFVLDCFLRINKSKDKTKNGVNLFFKKKKQQQLYNWSFMSCKKTVLSHWGHLQYVFFLNDFFEFFFFFLTLIVLAITPGIVLTERGLKQLLKLPVLT